MYYDNIINNKYSNKNAVFKNSVGEKFVWEYFCA